MKVYLIQLAPETGKTPVCIRSVCHTCACRLYGWLQLLKLRSRMLDVSEESAIWVAHPDGAELGNAMLEAFRAWRRAAIGDKPLSDHLQVYTG